MGFDVNYGSPLSDEEILKESSNQEVSLGDYVKSRFSETFEKDTTIGVAINESPIRAEEFKQMNPKQRFFDNFVPNHLKPKNIEDSVKRISKEEFESENLGEYGLKWFEGMSRSRAEIEHKTTMESSVRRDVVSRGETLGRQIGGFGVDLMANALDPINYMLVGPSTKAGATTLTKMLTGGSVAAAENLAVSTVTRPYWEDRGVESTWQDYALDSVFGFMLGGAVTGAVSKWQQRKANIRTNHQSKEIIKHAIANTANQIKKGEIPTPEKIPGYDEAMQDVFNNTSKVAEESIAKNVEEISQALNISEADAKSQLVPMVLNKYFEANERGLDPDELIANFIVENKNKFDGNGNSMALHQLASEQDPRASIDFNDNSSVIKLYKGADNSSILHETGHEFLNSLERIIDSGDSSPQTKTDFASVQSWLDTQDYKAKNKEITEFLKRSNKSTKLKKNRIEAKNKIERIKRHEFFARGFETYIHEGNAPSSKVARIFEKFKGWFRSLYKSKEMLNSNITPEMRDVYSRLMGGEQNFKLKELMPETRKLPELDPYNESEIDGLIESYQQGKLEDDNADIIKDISEHSKLTDEAIENYKKAGEALTLFQSSKKDAAKKLAKDLDITNKEAAEYIETLDELGNFGLIDDDETLRKQLSSVLSLLIEQLEKKKALEKRNALLQLNARKRLKSHVDAIINSQYKNQGKVKDILNSNGTPEKAILSYIEGDSRMRGVKGAGRAIYSDYQGLSQHLVRSMETSLKEIDPNIEKILNNDPDFNSNVIREMWEIREDGSGKSGITGDIKAMRVAGLLSKAGEEARVRLNNAGADIGKLDGWVPRRHDHESMIKSGRENWVSEMKDSLDLDRSFPGLRGESLDKALGETYDNLITSIHEIKELPGLTEGLNTTPANMAKKVGKTRVLHFKSSDAELSYIKKYAGGYNIVESMFGHIDNSARMITLMERLGPNPDAAIFAVIEQTKKGLRNGEYNIPKNNISELVQKLPSKSDLIARKTPIGQAMSIVTGESNMVGSLTGAKISGAIRGWNTATKLMGATLSQFGDALSVANEMKIIRDQGAAGAWVDTINSYFKSISPELRKSVLDKIGTIGDGFSMASMNRFDQVDNLNSKLNRMIEKGFQYSGMTGLTNRIKSGFGLSLSKEFAENTNKSWDDLHDGFREVLSQYGGIDSSKWDVIRKSSLTEVEGNKYFTPEKIRDLDDELIKSIIDKENISKTEIDKTKLDLEQAIRSVFVEETRNAVIEPDARSLRTTTLGHKRGTLSGEGMRFIMQFKSFAITYTQRTLGGRRFMKHKGDYGGVTHHLLAGTLLGYTSMVAKDLIKGKEPRDPTSGKTWVAALAQSGGLGILGDFALGKKSRFSGGYAGTLFGPTVGVAEDFLDLTLGNMNDAAVGEDADFVSDLIGFTQYNVPIPALNLWYTRTALNHLFWYQLRESLDPGSMRRMERRIKRDTNQDFFIKPSQSVR